MAVIPIPVDNYGINQGDTFLREYTWSVLGVVQDLTGYAVAAMLRANPRASGAPLATFTAVVSNAAGGKVLISLTSAQAAALFVPTMYHDVQVTSPAGVQTTIAEGSATLNFEVTR